MKLRLRAAPEEVMRAVAQLQAFGREQGVDERTLFGLAVALEECATNVVRHSLAGVGDAQFEVAFERVGGELRIELCDGGPAFDPTQAATPRPEAGEELGEDGGWGIHLTRRFVDEMVYIRAGNENILRLAKRFTPTAA